jgi:hypothetical protein
VKRRKKRRRQQRDGKEFSHRGVEANEAVPLRQVAQTGASDRKI